MADDRQGEVSILSYATPVALDRRGPWREGQFLVKPTGAWLPDRCVKCNAASTRVVYDVLYYFAPFRLTVSGEYRNVRVPLCASHWSMRVRSRRAAMAVGVAGMLSIATLLIGRLSGAAVPAMIVLGAALLFVSRFMNRAASPLRLAPVSRGRGHRIP